MILGAPRSGTTLVYRALCAHPSAAYPSNWVRRAPALPQLAAFNRLATTARTTRNRVWFGSDGRNAYAYNRRRAPWERWFPQPIEGEPLFARAGVPDEPAGQYEGTPAQQRRLAASFGQVRRWGGGDVLVVKRVANNRRVPLLLEAFPGCRFVHVLRDGRAVAASLRKVDWWADSHLFWYGDTPARWEAEGGDPWEACARHWVEEVRAIDAGAELVPDDRWLQVRFEDIVADTTPALRTIADFAGLPADPRWDEALVHLEVPDRNRGWRESLDPEVQDRIVALQADELARRGYDS